MSATRLRRTETGSRSERKPELTLVGRRRNKKLIKRTGARRLAPFTVLATIAIAAIIAGVLLEQVVLAQSAFKLTSIRRELTLAEEEREVLMLEAAKLDSAARIESYARGTLGMIDPAPNGVRYIVADIGTRTGSGATLAFRDARGSVDRAAAAAAAGATAAP